MALLTARNLTLCVLSLINFIFVFVTGADFVRFISFRPVYHNITGGAPLCDGKLVYFSIKATILLTVTFSQLQSNNAAERGEAGY